jgi:hypothetical protein
MSIENLRARITGQIWQAVAQSRVDLSSVPQEEQEKLVGKIADLMLVTLDSMLEEAAPLPSERENISTPGEPEDERSEKVLWQGRPYLSLVETYILTTERLKIVRGLISRDVENFELVRVQDIDYKQGVSERIFGVGDIFVRGQDISKIEIVLRNVKNPEQVYETLRKAWLEARKRHGLQFREYM